MVVETRKKPATIQDVATALGVTKSTVSRALSGSPRISADTRAAVEAAARSMGFEPNLAAQRLAQGHADSAVCLFSYRVDQNSGECKLRRIQNLLQEKGYYAPITILEDAGGAPDLQARHLAHLRRQQPRAIVLNTSELDGAARDELDRFRATGGVVVFYDLDMPVDYDQVIFDRTHNTYLAARHLLELGHREIGFHFNKQAATQVRWSGFVRAMQEFGVPIREEWMFHGMGCEPDGAALANQFLQLAKRPSAMCIINDVAATAFIVALQRHGLQVPRDVSVVGHDDLPMARYFNCVPLTSAAQPIDEIASTVVALLEQRLQQPAGTDRREIVVRGSLRVRESSAPVPS